MTSPYRSPAKAVKLNPIEIIIGWDEWNDFQSNHARLLAVMRAIANMKDDEGAVRVARDLLINMGIELP